MEKFLEGDLAGVAAGRHEQGAVGDAEVDAFLGGLAGQEAVGEAGCEAIPAADAVFDFEVLEVGAIIEFAFAPHDGRPVVDQGCLHAAERGADDLDVGEVLDDFLHHRLERAGVHFVGFDVDAFSVVAENLLKVFLVADEAVDVGDEGLGGFNGFLARPEFGAEVEVVGDDRAGFVGGLDGFSHDEAGVFGQRREDAPCVEPADAVFLEELLPVDLARLNASCGGVAAVIERGAGALGGADFGEVQADAVLLADTIPLALNRILRADTHRTGVVADDRTHWRRVQTAHPASAQTETGEGIGDVVFATTNPHFQRRAELNAAIARRRKTDHGFAQSHEIVLALFGWFNVDHGKESLPADRRRGTWRRGAGVCDFGLSFVGFGHRTIQTHRAIPPARK